MTPADRTPREGFTPLGPDRRHRVLPFFALVFASWLVWIPAGARMAGVLPVPFPTELAWLGVFTPCLLGTWFVFRAGGRPALGVHFGRFVRWRFPLRLWLFALLAMPAAAALTAVAFELASGPILADGWARLTDGTVVATGMGQYREASYESVGFFTGFNDWMASGTLAFVIGSLLLGFVDGGVSEEPGWRGFAYPVLQDRWGALPAALTVGLVWASWHLGPRQWAILFGEGTEAFLAFLPGYALTYLVGVMPLAILFAWLYEATGGSLLAVFVLHNAFNQTSATVSAMFPDAPVILGLIAFLWLAAIAVIVTKGWRTFGGARRGG